MAYVNEDLSLAGQRAIVTGASRGIGAATARLAAQRGYTVCITYLHNQAAAEAVVADITATGGRALAFAADVSVESDVMRLFEEQTKGEIKKSDFFTLPMSQTLAKMVTKGGRHRDFCVHPHCGVIALVALDKGKLRPINRFIDNEKLYFRMRRAFEMKKSRPGLMWDLVTGFMLYVKPSFWLRLFPLLKTKSYKSGRVLVDDWMRHNWITIGIMQFMDPYNFDLDRVQRCCLHYGVPDRKTKARLIPFCTMNNFHRQSIEREFAISAKAKPCRQVHFPGIAKAERLIAKVRAIRVKTTTGMKWTPTSTKIEAQWLSGARNIKPRY
mgnify:CR=1 FL=1